MYYYMATCPLFTIKRLHNHQLKCCTKVNKKGITCEMIKLLYD